MRLTMIKSKDNERLPQNYCDFAAPGGTIGRGTDNTLILPDQTRAISRLQAIVHISPGGGTYITHRGSTTPLVLNGAELPHNAQHPLADGDTLDIGGYRFSVSLQAQPAAAAPAPAIKPAGDGAIDDAVWADLEAEFPLRGLPRNRPALHDPDHPLFAGGGENRHGKDPLAMAQEADLASLNGNSTDPGRLFEQEEPLSMPTIMKDTTPTVLFSRAHVAPSAGESEHEDEEDELPQPGTAPLFNPAETLSAAREPEWNAGSDADEDDPLGLFLDNAVPLSSTLATNGLSPDTHQADALPGDPMPLAAPDFQPLPEDDGAEFLPGEPLISSADITWNEPSAMHEEPALNEPFAPFTPFDDLPPAAGAQETPAAPAPAPRLGIDPVRHQPFKPARSASAEHLNGELFSAFVAGLGLDDAQVQPDFTPEQLFLAGKLLSLFSQGTVALLSSRSILKRGLKAEMTVILEEENNPFKMLPSGKTVLMQIFSTPMPGFIPPESAVRDALIDLQAHQLGMIAGVRAIIAAMLQTFHPDTLEKMAAERGDLPNRGLFSGNRKAMLWDMLKLHYQRVANEVEDDFHTLFGEAFLHAYDLEIRQYKASQSPKGA